MMKFISKIILIALSFTTVLFSQNRIAIVLPTEIRETNKTSEPELINDITAFEIFLMQNKINYSVIYSDELTEKILQKFNALIFPTSVNISEDNYYSLEEALKNGIGIISFGNFNYSEDDSRLDICNTLYGVESQQNSESNNQNFFQHFHINTNLLRPANDFELLISSASVKNLYEVNNNTVFSFGCYDDNNQLTTSFYGFKSSGRFAHFGFSFSKIISDKKSVKAFENLLLSLFSWIQKDSGIWLTETNDNENYYLFLLDLTKGSFLNSATISKIFEKNLKVVIASDSPEKLNAIYNEYDDKAYLALKFNCTNNIDTLIKNINLVKNKIDFLILENNCLDERDIKRLSFAGIETILIRNDDKFYFNPIYNVLSVSYSSIVTSSCTRNKIVIVEYPEKLSCEEMQLDNFLSKISILHTEQNYFNRDKLINDFLISELTVNTFQRSGEFVIEIKNTTESEIRDLDLIIDYKELHDKMIYDFKVNGQSRFIQKDSLTGYYRVRLNSIAPKSDIRVNILIDDNI